MRLTLRTLLAWLDDTLSPAEVREIGTQVGESTFAKELVDRVNRVTRQRRLTVPGSTGADATDPNTVAGYIDSTLNPEQVADYEKRCLTSDVHLAEVASVHQILSLIGQKAKVPDEAKQRMYRLFKGREAVVNRPPPRPQAAKPSTLPGPGTTRARAPEPMPSWTSEIPHRAPVWQRFGPAAAVSALIGVFLWSAYMSLDVRPPGNRPPAAVEVAKADPAPPVAVAQAPKAAAPEVPAAATKDEAKAPEPAEPATAEPVDAAKPPLSLPAGAAGGLVSTDGAIVRYDAPNREWDRIAPEAPILPGERVVGLSPFRSTLQMGKAKVDVVGATEIQPMPRRGTAPMFALLLGRVVLDGGPSPASAWVKFGEKEVAINLPAGVAVGLERFLTPTTGGAAAVDPGLTLFVRGGEASLGAEAGPKFPLAGPAAYLVHDPAKAPEKIDGAPQPPWLSADSASPFEKQLLGQFAAYLKNDRPPIVGITEATDDPQKEVRLLAIGALGMLGELPLIVPALGKPNDATSRRAAISVMRSIDDDPRIAPRLRDELKQAFGDEQSAIVAKLLAGFSAEEAKSDATYAKLVSYLGSPELAVRELALENLQALTGRDALEFDPDKPTGPGLKAWQDLLAQKKLHAAGR